MKNEKDRARYWQITQFVDVGDVHYSAEDMKKALDPYSYVFQLEKSPSTGRLHYQCYIEHKNPIRFSTLKSKLPTAHIEVARNKNDLALYCSKDKTYQGERYVKGIDLDDIAARKSEHKGYDAVIHDVMVMNVSHETINLKYPGIAARSGRWLDDLYIQKKHAEWGVDVAKLSTSFRDVKVHYLWGAPGVGKTRSLFDKYGSSMYSVPHYGRGVFDGYVGQPVLVLDEFRSQIDFSFLLKLLDGYPLVLPARYSDKLACYTSVYVVSNIPLTDQYPDIQNESPESWAALLRRFDSIDRVI